MQFEKLVQVCKLRNLLSEDYNLVVKNNDPTISSSSSVSLGRAPDKDEMSLMFSLAAADMFLMQYNPELLIPEEPPKALVERATLPGTNRKPIKPWQLCTDDEKVWFVSYLAV